MILAFIVANKFFSDFILFCFLKSLWVYSFFHILHVYLVLWMLKTLSRSRNTITDIFIVIIAKSDIYLTKWYFYSVKFFLSKNKESIFISSGLLLRHSECFKGFFTYVFNIVYYIRRHNFVVLSEVFFLITSSKWLLVI